MIRTGLFYLLLSVFGVHDLAAETSNKTLVEDLTITGKALVSLDVGTTRAVTQISQDGRSQRIGLRVNVDVSTFVYKYYRHTSVDAWYDAQGLVVFVTEIDEDGKITRLNGLREHMVRDRDVIHLVGIVKGVPVDKVVPIEMFNYTSVENYPYVSALARESNTWRVLNLFTGEVDLVRVTPERVVNCPSPVPGECFQISKHSADNQGTHYFTLDGQLVGAEGDDQLGHYVLSSRHPPTPAHQVESEQKSDAPPAEAEPKEEKPGTLLKWLFGDTPDDD